MNLPNPTPVSPSSQPIELNSVLDMLLNGGPMMIPIGLCSILALGYVVERSIRLRESTLGSKRLGRQVVDTLESKDVEAALRFCRDHAKPLTRVLGAGFKRFGNDRSNVEKAVEDAGRREVKRLSANLKPLIVIGMLTPLLGLLGTVWGMIEAFSQIAGQDGLGKPELLAGGISQALITTAAGLCVAIPTQAAYYWLRGRIDRFVYRCEDIYLEVETQLGLQVD